MKNKRRFLILLAVFILTAGCGFAIFLHTKAVDKPLAGKPGASSGVSSRKEPAASRASSGEPPASSKPAEKAQVSTQIISVPLIQQDKTLPTGCELTSAMMLLKHFGCSTTTDEIVRRTPKVALLSESGKTYGMSPNQAFIGSPRSTDGLGCYAPVVTAVVDSYFWDGGKEKAVNLTGTELDTLARNYLANGSPVLIWATVGMGEPGRGQDWILADTNEDFQWISGEHCFLMVGYDREEYYFNDPLSSGGPSGYPKALVEARYRALGKQAVSVHSVT